MLGLLPALIRWLEKWQERLIVRWRESNVGKWHGIKGLMVV